MEFVKYLVTCVILWCLLLFFYFNIHPSMMFQRNSSPRPSTLSTTKAEKVKQDTDWQNVPKFQLYIRMSSNPRFLYEYKQWFLRSYKQNFPPQRWEGTVVLGFDDESARDHVEAEKLKASWPHPHIYYHKKADNEKIYYEFPRYRGFWDQFYPERYTEAEYVGYADTDTIFSSLVTPNSLFFEGKAIMIGRVGQPTVSYWPKTTEYILGQKEVAQYMSYFPVLIKVKHVIELRHFISRRFNKPFNQLFRSFFRFGYNGFCQFSVMCNYVWYYHRHEYEFRFQLSPNGNLDGKDSWQPGMESLTKVRNQNRDFPERFLPAPRVAIHGRYLRLRNHTMVIDDMNKPNMIIHLNNILTENFCYVIGFQIAPECCTQYNSSAAAHYLFQFEYWVWTWHEGCMEAQNKYIMEARELLKHNEGKGLPVFGQKSKIFQCPKDWS